MKSKELILFLDRLSIMLKSGVSVSDSLTSLSKSSNKKVSELSRECLKSLKAGRHFSNGLRKVLSSEEYSVLVAGEKSGDIVFAIEKVKTLITAKQKIKASIVSALSYPVVILLMTVGMIYVLGNKVAGEVAGIIGEETVSRTTFGLLIKLSQPHVLLTIIGSIFFTIFSLALFMSKVHTNIRFKTDKYFPFSVYRFLNGVVFLYIFASLLKSGFNVVDALKEIEKFSKYFKLVIPKYVRGVLSAKNIGEAMKSVDFYLPDKDTAEFLSTVSNYSNFEDKLFVIADEYIQTTPEKIKGYSKILNYLALTFAGAVIILYIAGLQQVMGIAFQSIRQ